MNLGTGWPVGAEMSETRQRKGLWFFLLKGTMAVETGSHSVAQAGLELMAILLYQPLWC